MKLSKLELIEHLGLDEYERGRLYSGLKEGIYNHPFVAFCASGVASDEMKVCKSTINWIKSSRRFCTQDSDPMNDSQYKVSKTISKLQESDSEYDTFVFGYVDIDTSEFHSSIVINRNDYDDSLMTKVIDSVRERAILLYSSSKFSEMSLRQSMSEMYDGDKKYLGVIDKLLEYIQGHVSTIDAVEKQIDIRSSDIRFTSFIEDYLIEIDGEVKPDGMNEQYKLINELFKIGVITMMFKHSGIEYSDIFEVTKILDPSGSITGYPELIEAHGSDIGVIFEFDIKFIKGFTLR